VAGVPEMIPVEVSRDSPAGRPVAPKLAGLFIALIRYLKGLLALPLAVVALVMTGTCGGALTAKAMTYSQER
jgi:hypothetical protein